MPRVSDDNEDGTHGNDNDGSHVGLMQMGNSLERAWDWQENCDDGVDHFHDKVGVAMDEWDDWKAEYTEATGWTAEQLEDVAIGFYGPHGGQGTYWIWDDEDDEWSELKPSRLKALIKELE